MKTTKRESMLPSAEWQSPAATWVEILDRYVTYIQVPAWRVNAFTRDGMETRPSIPAEEAMALRAKMLRTIEAVAGRRSVPTNDCVAERNDLRELLRLQGQHIPRSERCPKEVCWHLQRAFLLNESGYSCVYCGRTAWGVYADKAEGERPRTLRFEMDHRTPKRTTRSTSRDTFMLSIRANRASSTFPAK
jgi:hypothetical protein